DTYSQCGMYDRKGRKEKKKRQHNLTKITGKTGEVLTSPKKDMYIMHGWEGKNKNM
ncbi:hypothetical protein BSAG_05033, partial [Bacteroides sp. D1]